MTLEVFLKGRPHLVVVWEHMAVLLADENLDYIHANFEGELRLNEGVWAAMFAPLPELFAPLPTPSWAEVQVILTAVFQNHTLAGPVIADTPEPKGRALDTGRFMALLDEAGLPDDGKTQLLNDIRAGGPIDLDAAELKQCNLGSYLMWSTFQAAGGDPFEGCADAATVRERLGLLEPVRAEDEELCLLVYTVPSDVNIQYPTLADAYAGDDWPALFRCSNPGDAWGYTSGGHPEVVHEVITGTHLARTSYIALRTVR